jgi:hypothetical protein
MPWTERTFIFKPSGEWEWSLTHAQVPSALLLHDRIRIYYATRDSRGRSLTSFIDVARNDPSKILYIHPEPVMMLGAAGTHDEDGVMVGCVVAEENDVLLYYTGWSRGGNVPYRVSVGLARSSDNGLTFVREFEGPVVDRTAREPYMTMSPYVLREADKWRMWYGSGTGWLSVQDKMEPLYVVKYAESRDGRFWQQDDVLCIPPLHAMEANTRPSVVKTDTGYSMWFSYRDSIDFRNGAGAYHIGHALSRNGAAWERKSGPQDLAPSGAGWDGRMTAYPNVLQCDGRLIMFYNGDGFGQSGFGFAVWQD